MNESDFLFSGNENLMLGFDDGGEMLQVGDRVLVNDEKICMIGEVEGKRVLVGWPDDEIVHYLERITEPDPIATDWPDSLAP